MKKRILCFAIISVFLWLNSSVAEKPGQNTPSPKKDKPLLEKITLYILKRGMRNHPGREGEKKRKTPTTVMGFSVKVLN